MSTEIHSDLPNWEDLKNQKSVVNEKYDFPKYYPEPLSFIKPQGFSIFEEDLMQGVNFRLFDLDPLSEGEYSSSHGKYFLHTSKKYFNKIISDCSKAPYITIDIETTGLDPILDKVRTIQISASGNYSHIVYAEKIGNDCIELVKEIYKFPSVFQNGSFDTAFLLVKTGFFPEKYAFDTLIAAQNIDAGLYESRDRAFGLGALAKRYLGIYVDKSQQKSFKDTVNRELTEDQLKYAADDTIITWRLAAVLAPIAKKVGIERSLRELDLHCVPISVDIKVQGVPINVEYIKSLEKNMLPELKEIEKELVSELGLNPDSLKEEYEGSSDAKSAKKLIEAFQKLGHNLTSTSEGAIGTYFLNKSVRKVSEKEIVEITEKCRAAGLLLKYRYLSKNIDAFLVGYRTKHRNPITGNMHPTMNICGSMDEGTSAAGGKEVATGRTSFRDPNVQQAPSEQKFRNIFQAPPGFAFIKVDASQQEVRVLADISKDKALQSIYLNEGSQAADIYREVASLVLKKRKENVDDKERQVYKCLDKNSIVCTEFGYKKISHVNVGEKILTSSGYKTILFKKSSRSKVNRLFTSKGIIYCTPDHKFYDCKNNAWKETKDFKFGEYIEYNSKYFPTFNGSYSISWESSSLLTRVPIEIFNYTPIDKLKFLTELISNKGCLYNNPYRIIIRNNNPDFLSDLVYLFSTLGIDTNIGYQNEYEYQLRIPGHSINRLISYGMWDFMTEENKSKFKYLKMDKVYNFSSRAKVISNFKTESAEVYDITVEGVHEFLVQGLRTHNCVVLGVGYSAGPKTISEVAGISMDEAKNAINNYFKTFPKVKDFIIRSENEARTKGFINNTYSGRRRGWNHKRIEELNLQYKYRTQAANHYIQSGSADCGKKALILAYKRMSELGGRVLMPVHDELTALVPWDKADEGLKVLENCMVEGSQYWMKTIPMKAEGNIGRTWRKSHNKCDFCETEADPKKKIKVLFLKVNQEKCLICKKCYEERKSK